MNANAAALFLLYSLCQHESRAQLGWCVNAADFLTVFFKCEEGWAGQGWVGLGQGRVGNFAAASGFQMAAADCTPPPRRTLAAAAVLPAAAPGENMAYPNWGASEDGGGGGEEEDGREKERRGERKEGRTRKNSRFVKSRSRRIPEDFQILSLFGRAGRGEQLCHVALETCKFVLQLTRPSG